MAYSTIDQVRSESGFTNNSNITDAMITIYLNQANGVVQSFVSSIYNITTLTGTNFTGSQADLMLQRVEDLLASGYLMIKEYGAEWLDSDKDGYNKVDEWMSLLKMMTSGDLRLIGVDGTEFTRVNKDSAGTATAGGAVSGDNIFAVSDEY